MHLKVANDDTFWVEWVDTDSGKEMRQNALAVARRAGELRLVVNDPELLQLIAETLSAINDSTSMGLLLAEGKSAIGGSKGSTAMAGAITHVRKIEAAFVAVEERAAQLLRGDL
jgi:hypothetical protein